MTVTPNAELRRIIELGKRRASGGLLVMEIAEHNDLRFRYADDLARQLLQAREALRKLCNAADDVGVRFFDTDTEEPEVADLQSATLAARALLPSASQETE